MQPIILITIYRRYRELLLVLDNIERFKDEFSKPPIIIIVWSSPEISREWVFQELIERGRIHYVIPRLTTQYDGNGRATSHPESLNLRLGLEWIENNIDEPYYVIGQSGDIITNEGIYGLIDKNIVNYKAVLFHWNNTISLRSWHTNLFAVRDKEYWPPLSSPGEFDTLETQWAKYLDNNHLTNFLTSHNSRDQKFTQVNISEEDAQIDKKPQKGVFTMQCQLVGYKSIWWYIKFYFNSIFKRGKNG